MKQTLAIAIVLASFATYAQTETTTATTTTTTTAPAAPVVKSKVKKVVKKKSSKPSAQVAPAAAPAAVVQAAPAAESVKAEAVTAAAPAGTSTAAVADAAPTKNWSVSLVSQANLTNESVVHKLKDAPVEIINYAGAGYKVTKDTKIGFRQYFNTDLKPEKETKAVSSWSVATVGTKVEGIAGSDAISPLFWYYMPTQTALKNVYNTDDTINHQGILRMDAEIAWTLNPKWTVSYYLNPRQSIVSKQSYKTREGDDASIESTTTLIHYGYVYYNVSDAIQPYAYLGADHRMTTGNLTSVKDHALIGIGASFTMFGGAFILNPEISNEVALKDGGKTAGAPRWLQSEDMAYQLTAVLTY